MASKKFVRIDDVEDDVPLDMIMVMVLYEWYPGPWTQIGQDFTMEAIRIRSVGRRKEETSFANNLFAFYDGILIYNTELL